MLVGSLYGLIAVTLGAYAAHGLRQRLGERLLAVFETGVDYQAVHALALLFTGLMLLHTPESRWAALAGWLFLIGIVLFSGSLYLLAITGYSKLGIVTPFGGGILLLGWLALVVFAIRELPATSGTGR